MAGNRQATSADARIAEHDASYLVFSIADGFCFSVDIVDDPKR